MFIDFYINNNLSVVIVYVIIYMIDSEYKNLITAYLIKCIMKDTHSMHKYTTVNITACVHCACLWLSEGNQTHTLTSLVQCSTS